MRCTPLLLSLGLAAVLATQTAPLQAQDRDVRESPPPGPSVLKLTTSTRALALGGAFLMGGGRHGVFHHPSLISGQGFDVTLGGSRAGPADGDRDRAPDDLDDDDEPGHKRDALYGALSTGAAWMGGTVAVGIAVFNYGSGRDGDAPRERDLDRDRRVAASRVWPAGTEFVGAVGYRRAFFGFDFGAAAKVVGQSVAGTAARTGAVDAGMSRGIGRLTAALTVQNLGPDLDLAGRKVPLPARVTMGAGTRSRAPVGPLDIGAAAQVSYERDGAIVPGGGVEVAYWPIQRRIFIVRIGAVRVVEGDGLPLTFGAGFEGDRIRLDYAYSEHDPAAGSHRFGISIG